MIKVDEIKWLNTKDMRTYYNRALPSLQIFEAANGMWRVVRDKDVKGDFHLLIDAINFANKYMKANGVLAL